MDDDRGFPACCLAGNERENGLASTFLRTHDDRKVASPVLYAVEEPLNILVEMTAVTRSHLSELIRSCNAAAEDFLGERFGKAQAHETREK